MMALPERTKSQATIRVSHKLSIALRETIRQHAETYHGGKIDMDRTLSVIGDLVSDLLTDIADREHRDRYFSALILDLAQSADFKIVHQSTRQ